MMAMTGIGKTTCDVSYWKGLSLFQQEEKCNVGTFRNSRTMKSRRLLSHCLAPGAHGIVLNP